MDEEINRYKEHLINADVPIWEKKWLSIEEAAAYEEQILLFTTKTCPNCRIAGAILNQAGVAFDKIDAEEQVDLVNTYGVRQAPTLIVVKGKEFTKYNNASEIKKFAETR